MAYKSLTTIVTSATEAQSVIAPAATLAVALDAHLEILALGIDRTQVGYSYVGGGGALLQISMERAEAEAREAEAAVRKACGEQPADLRWSVESAVAQIGALGDLVGLRARFADLVVLPRPYGKGRGSEAEAVVEAALFEGQAPVLVLPGPALATLPQRAVIAWNQSREA
ncbi:MAG: universal stress protein, partial [Gemmobacter sp.]|nr:universal stress protein [Gemmobacter sp.]